MRRNLFTLAAGLLGVLCASGCGEGPYKYEYSGRITRPDGTPALGVPLLPQPGARESIFGSKPKFSRDDPQVVLSDPSGRFSGTMSGWFAAPILWPFPPPECRLSKVWLYMPDDATKGTWKAIVVPVTVERHKGLPCGGNINEFQVTLPDWYIDGDKGSGSSSLPVAADSTELIEVRPPAR